jgi:hypothetical protein
MDAVVMLLSSEHVRANKLYSAFVITPTFQGYWYAYPAPAICHCYYCSRIFVCPYPIPFLATVNMLLLEHFGIVYVYNKFGYTVNITRGNTVRMMHVCRHNSLTFECSLGPHEMLVPPVICSWVQSCLGCRVCCSNVILVVGLEHYNYCFLNV